MQEISAKILAKLKVNKKCALALYTGIVTDSNRFLYEGVNSETFETASR